jgi:AAA15 family ATPase/GTPase
MSEKKKKTEIETEKTTEEKDQKREIQEKIETIKEEVKIEEQTKPENMSKYKKKREQEKKEKEEQEKKEKENEEKLKSMSDLFSPVIGHLTNMIFLRLNWEALTPIEEKMLNDAMMSVSMKWFPYLFKYWFEEINFVFVLLCIMAMRIKIPVLNTEPIINVKPDETATQQE